MAETSQKIDQAALLGVALAAVVSISASGGSWEVLESAIGVVLLLVVGAFFDGSAARSRPDWPVLKYAVAGVLSLIWCLVLAYWIQLFFAKAFDWNEKTLDEHLHIPLGVVVLALFIAHVFMLTRSSSKRVLGVIRVCDAWLEEKVRSKDRSSSKSS